MGYKITSLANLPLKENVNLFIFSVGDNVWKGGLHEIVHGNFDDIAKNIGPDAIIVEALDNEMHDEVARTYLGIGYQELQNLLPALLITDAHPDTLNDQSLRILIPLRNISGNQHYNFIEDFFRDLVAFANGTSDTLLQKIEDTPNVINDIDAMIRFSLPIVPGFVVIDLNNTIRKLREYWDELKR